MSLDQNPRLMLEALVVHPNSDYELRVARGAALEPTNIVTLYSKSIQYCIRYFVSSCDGSNLSPCRGVRVSRHSMLRLFIKESS